MSIPFGNSTTFIFDVDGVLTDGSVWSYESQHYVRRFYIKDGYAIDAKQTSIYTSGYAGGRDAVRYVIERVMRVIGDWKPEQW